MTATVQDTARVQRVTLIGLAANLALVAVKFAGGFLGNSRAVVADAVHSLTDCATDVAILVGARFWGQPPDDSHPHGHGRIETLVTVGIGVALGAAGVGIFWDALAGIAGDGTGQSGAERPGPLALTAAAVSVVVKEILYRWTDREGRRLRSSALVANAWHHRSDALSSLPAFGAVLVALVWPDWSFVDFVGAIVVSLFIFQAAWKIVAPALLQLVDAAAPEADRRRIEALAAETEGVLLVHDVRTRSVGAGVAVDLSIHVAPDITVREGHAIASAVKRRLLADGPDVVDVVVHVDPHE